MVDREYEFSLSILVADAEEATRRLLGETLNGLGYQTLLAPDVDDAWKVIEQQKIDLVISDVFMPEGAGVQFLLRIKKEKPDIPVIILASRADESTREELSDAGADGILVKPFRISKVEEIIATTLMKYDRAAVSVPRSSKRILLVDDDRGLLSFMMEAVKALGYEVEAVGNAEAAVRAFMKKKFDLIISDFILPDSNGVELLKKIKKMKSSTPFVIVTGYPLAYPPAMAKADGVEGYLAKPFRVNQLEQVIASLLYPERQPAKDNLDGSSA
jgi:CheY-like chemotaxis protein